MSVLSSLTSYFTGPSISLVLDEGRSSSEGLEKEIIAVDSFQIEVLGMRQEDLPILRAEKNKLEASYQKFSQPKSHIDGKIKKTKKHIEKLQSSLNSCRAGKASRAKKSSLQQQIQSHQDRLKLLQRQSNQIDQLTKRISELTYLIADIETQQRETAANELLGRDIATL